MIQGCSKLSSIVILFLQNTNVVVRRSRGGPSPHNLSSVLLGVLDQQTADEIFGQLAGVAEVFLIEVVVDGGDVGEGLLLGFAEKR